MWYHGSMYGYNINQEPADKLDTAREVNKYIDFDIQPTIPRNIADRLSVAHAKRVQNTMYFEPTNKVDGPEEVQLKDEMSIIEARHGRVRRMGVVASGRIDGIRRKQEDIARRIASARVYGAEQKEESSAAKAKGSAIDRDRLSPAATQEKVKTRLSELERISSDINQNIAHIDAVVAIKDNYLHQLRTAEKLLARYNATQASGDEDKMDDAEIFHAAYTVIMNNVPRRYNPEATNAKGHETIGQVIARLEHEVADLNAKAAEEGFEVGLEMALLNEIQSDPNIDAETLDNKANQAVDRYVKTMSSAGAKAINEDRAKNITQNIVDRMNSFLKNITTPKDSYDVLAREINPAEVNYANLVDYTNKQADVPDIVKTATPVHDSAHDTVPIEKPKFKIKKVKLL